MQEVDIKQKDMIGSGASHKVFPYHKFTDKIIKTRMGDVKFDEKGNKTIDNWRKLNVNEIKFMAKHPEYFAKVYKYTDKYAVIEKLNTKDFMSQVNISSYGLFNFAVRFPELALKIFPYHVNVEISDAFDINVSMLLYYLLAKKDADMKQAQLAEHVKNEDFFNNLYSVIKKVTYIYPRIDCHDYNLGFDDKGKIKFLDI